VGGVVHPAGAATRPSTLEEDRHLLAVVIVDEVRGSEFRTGGFAFVPPPDVRFLHCTLCRPPDGGRFGACHCWSLFCISSLSLL